MLGELAVRRYFGLDFDLEADYEKHTVDQGDLVYRGKVYDVKTDAIPQSFFNRVAQGSSKNYEPYAGRVFTARHLRHVQKYSGGIIFCIYRIPDEEDQEADFIRESLLKNGIVIITGYVPRKKITAGEPTWYSPPDPQGHRRKYNSKNFLFFNRDLQPVSQLIA